MLQAAILGSDLILAALPAEPVQVIHACSALGYEVVVPPSWGDELVASGILEQLADRPGSPAIACSCPQARRRILSPGTELSPFMLQTVAPPVASARYLEALYAGTTLNITFIGACPSADDPAIAHRMLPSEFLELCVKRGVSLLDQPTVFDERIPVDRRRFHSLPGGLPSLEAIRAVHPGMDVLAPDAQNLSFDVAQCVVAGRPALLDLGCAVGCACSGFSLESASPEGREMLCALEPPRSTLPVLEASLPVELELPIPAVPLTMFEESVPLSVVMAADRSVHRDDRRLSTTDLRGAHSSAARNVSREFIRDSDERDDHGDVSGNDLASAFEWSRWTESAGFRGDDPSARSSSTQSATTEEPDSAFQSSELAAPSEGTQPKALSPEPDRSEAVPQPRAAVARQNGTPTGTPAVRTAAGVLPRAYLMRRRISGQHQAIPGAATPRRQKRTDGPPVHEQEKDAASRSEHGAARPTDAPSSAQEDQSQSGQQQTEPTHRASVPHSSASSGERDAVDTVLDFLSRAIREVVDPDSGSGRQPL